MPPDLVTAFRKSHGADVSDVPVHRGRRAAERAQAIEAGAFTSDGEVFLPAEAGPLTEPTARGILAHELAHVVQQRTLGSTLPDERTAAGQRLETDARAHEEWAKTGAIGAPPVGLHAASPQEHAPGPAMIHPKVQRTPRSTAAVEPTSTPTSTSASSTPTSSTPTSTSSSSTSSTTSTGSSSLSSTSSSDTADLVGGVRLPDNTWTQRHDAITPRNASELGNAFAESFGGVVLDEWGIDGADLPGGGFEQDTRRTQLRTQLLDEVNAERRRQHIEPQLTELPPEAMQLVEDQLDDERLTAQGLSGSGRGSGRGRTGPGHGAVGTGHSPGGTATGRGAGGAGSGNGQQQDDGRIRSFRQFGGELALGMVDLMGGGMGIDLTADEENDIRGRSATSGAAGGSGTDTGARSATGTQQAAGQHGEHPDGELIDPDRMDLDELAVRIYDRLRTRLRRELLVDRERAGLLSDFR